MSRCLCLVLGGSGTVGRATCKALLAEGWRLQATHLTRPAASRDGLVWHQLSLAEQDSVAALVEATRSDAPTLVVDALGRFSTIAFGGDCDALLRLAWENCVGRARLLGQLLSVLPERAVVVRLESSLGAVPSVRAPTFSALRAADRPTTALLAREGAARGIIVGSVVLSGLSGSLTLGEERRLIQVSAAPPPTADAAAQAIVRVAAIMKATGVSARLELGQLLAVEDV